MADPTTVDPTTPTGALNILTQLADTYQGNWASHQAVRTALTTVGELIRRLESLDREKRQAFPESLNK